MRYFVLSAIKFPCFIIYYYHLSPDEFNDITILNARKVYLTHRPVQPRIGMQRKLEDFDTCICSEMNRRDDPRTLGLTEESVNKFIYSVKSRQLDGRVGQLHLSDPLGFAHFLVCYLSI